MRIAFEFYGGNVEDLPPVNKKVSCHIIFDVKMGENFCCKSQMVAVGHNTTSLSSLTYSLGVYQDSVRVALTIYVMNDLKVLACDIHNVYLTERFWGKIWTVAGPYFGPEQGKSKLLVRKLHELK